MSFALQLFDRACHVSRLRQSGHCLVLTRLAARPSRLTRVQAGWQAGSQRYGRWPAGKGSAEKLQRHVTGINNTKTTTEQSNCLVCWTPVSTAFICRNRTHQLLQSLAHVVKCTGFHSKGSGSKAVAARLSQSYPSKLHALQASEVCSQQMFCTLSSRV